MYINSGLYKNDIKRLIYEFPSWSFLNGRKLLVVGGSGLIGTFLCDVIMEINRLKIANIELHALCRNRDVAEKRFASYRDCRNFKLIIGDINNIGDLININTYFDFIIHAASNSHPVLYRTKPIETIISNVLGTYNLLNHITLTERGRFLFCSSVEIYGETLSSDDDYQEDYCGYINCNTLRAGYPESKRVGEALCQAFIEEKKTDIVIARLSRTYGPTMRDNDSRAIGQFITSAVNGENIVLKSKGNQIYSYVYVYDAVSAIFYVLAFGEKGQAYNIKGVKSDVALIDLAKYLAIEGDVKLVFDNADETEAKGYSTATRAVLDDSKLRNLGWQAVYTINVGIRRTIKIMKKDNYLS